VNALGSDGASPNHVDGDVADPLPASAPPGALDAVNRFLGTHTGDMVTPQGTVPATGKRVELRFADYFKVAGDKVIEHRTYFDQASMMAQLGAG
jgi:predicted ester cyclase